MSSSNWARKLESSAKSDVLVTGAASPRSLASGNSGSAQKGHGYDDLTVLSRLDLRGRADLSGALEPPGPDDGPLDAVRAILATVRDRGDAALRDFTERFDGCRLDELRIPRVELDAALAAAPAELRAALEYARDRITEYHERQRPAPAPAVERDGIAVQELAIPGRPCRALRARRSRRLSVDRADDRDPGRIAGVTELALCVPPDADGDVPHGDARGRRARRGRRGVPGRRRAGDRRARLRHRVDPRRST